MYTNTCVICGKQFESKYKRTLLCHSPHEKQCIQCGNTFYVTSENRNVKFCSLTCSGMYRKQSGLGKQISKKAIETKKQRYGDKPSNVSSCERICSICGKSFTPTSNHQTVCKDKHTGPCPVCGKPSNRTSKYHVSACSYKCRMELMKRTNMQRYGAENSFSVKEIRDKGRLTCKQKYGNEIYQRTKDYQDKTNKTCLQHYGTMWPAQSDEVKAKIKETMLEKYGGYPFQNEHVVQKAKQNSLDRYGVEHPSKRQDQKDRYETTCMKKYGVHNTLQLDCSIAKQPFRISANNIHVSNLLNDSGIKTEFEYLVGCYRYDVGIPGQHVVIEVDPTCTHNSYRTIRGHEGVERDYHLSRTLEAARFGFTCVHVWDWDDTDKVCSLFHDRNTVYARKCNIVNISASIANLFLNQYHLQGTCKGQKACYALVKDDDILEVMTFGQPRYNKNFEWEMLRLCAKSGVSVSGGAERLFSHFVKEYAPTSVVSYCDRSKFTGHVYEKLGFKLESAGKPTKHWYSSKKSEKMQHITDSFLRQCGFDQIFGTNFGKGTSNEALMIDRGYLPVYDCGQMRFAWHGIV